NSEAIWSKLYFHQPRSGCRARPEPQTAGVAAWKHRGVRKRYRHLPFTPRGLYSGAAQRCVFLPEHNYDYLSVTLMEALQGYCIEIRNTGRTTHGNPQSQEGTDRW